jgi:hypothetical protein
MKLAGYCNWIIHLSSNTFYMSIENGGPRIKEENTESTFETMPDVTPRREGGDDALAETNPSDSRLDEFVIVNEQRENKIVNSPSQTEVHTSELENTVDES